jgi:hypothetical protein
MRHGHVSMVDRYIPVVSEVEKRFVKHSWEPRAMLAHGTQPPILSDGDMGVVVHVHLKAQP